MKKIDNLSPEQIQRFGEWSQRWIEIGLSTEPADFDAATSAALKTYKICNLEKPMVVLRMGSPYAATVGGALAWMYLRAFFGAQVWDQVGDQVRAQVRDQVRDQVWAQVRDQVRDQVTDQVWDQVWAQTREGLNNDRGGAFWAPWCALISFFRDVCGWSGPALARFEIDEALTKSCGWVWWHQNVVAISDRPSALHRDARGRLHCEDGPSIAYRDGWALYHWHGTAVPRDVIEAPETLTAGAISFETNAEVRRVMVERFGLDRFITESGAAVLHEDRDPLGNPRRLLQKSFGDDMPLTLVQVKNSTVEPDGTVKDYFLSVHHELRPLLGDGRLGGPQKMTCRNAVASTFGMTGTQYAVAAES